MWRNWPCVALLVVAFSIAARQSMSADSNTVTHAKAILVIIGSSLDGCYLDWQEADLLDRTHHIPESQAKLGELSRCIESAPNETRWAVDSLRAAVSKKPQALAMFKDYVLTYRALLAQLGSRSTTLAEAANFEAILDGKAAKVIAEIEW
jgi:hypothetical protein